MISPESKKVTCSYVFMNIVLFSSVGKIFIRLNWAKEWLQFIKGKLWWVEQVNCCHKSREWGMIDDVRIMLINTSQSLFIDDYMIDVQITWDNRRIHNDLLHKRITIELKQVIIIHRGNILRSKCFSQLFIRKRGIQRLTQLRNTVDTCQIVDNGW